MENRNDFFKNYRFRMSIDSMEAVFMEVSGLTNLVDSIEYGSSMNMQRPKFPGLPMYTNITLKHGISNSMELNKWIIAAENGSIERKKVTISLMNENTTMIDIWERNECWPVKSSISLVDNPDSGLLIESLELAYIPSL